MTKKQEQKFRAILRKQKKEAVNLAAKEVPGSPEHQYQAGKTDQVDECLKAIRTAKSKTKKR